MRRQASASVVLLVCAALAAAPAGCGEPAAGAPDAAAPPGPDAGPAGPVPWTPELGGRLDGDRVRFAVVAPHATRVEVSIYAQALGAPERLRVPLAADAATGTWRGALPLAQVRAAGVDTIYYGYRAWGPSWTFDPAWTPGSARGFVADVDPAGHRMNPNKLLIDPYALEISHDPTNPAQLDRNPYRVGAEWRAVDSGPVAPKSIVLPPPAPGAADLEGRPTRAMADDIVYEVHLRGLTRLDAAAGACAGTYAGVAARADHLAALGVTVVELLPVQETWNDANDVDPQSASGDNYWGYSTLAFFAPDRRYACDRTPGGPTREFRDMVRALHARGLKVWIDVVYNHTAEGGGGSLLSLRGLDNAEYYVLSADGQGFTDHTGVGANVRFTSPATRQLVLDSLRYYADGLGVDGFRFDLASVLGNQCEAGCFDYHRSGFLKTIAETLPARAGDGGAGVDLVAEPWGIGAGTYQLGAFPAGWAEWNGQFRDLVRADQNQLGVTGVTLGWLADRVAGSPELFGDDGRGPASSVNYVVSHDGFTLHDLHHCNGKNNGQAWPYGPSGGGDDANRSWDHGGDPAAQRQAARTSLALLVLSAGVPMIVGGDELLRTQRCNNNPYNLDSEATWVDWERAASQAHFLRFATRLFWFRRAHAALRPRSYWSGDQVTWRRADGQIAQGAFMDDEGQQVLAWRLDGAALGDDARALFVAYNGGATAVEVRLPAPGAGARWYRVADTAAWMEPMDNASAPGSEYQMQGDRYQLEARALALFVER